MVPRQVIAWFNSPLHGVIQAVLVPSKPQGGSIDGEKEEQSKTQMQSLDGWELYGEGLGGLGRS